MTKAQERCPENSFREPPSQAAHTLAKTPSRVLAAVIDYLVFLSFSFALQGFVLSELARFLTSLLFGLIYYGTGNSNVLQGQTLGKRVFGLRTVKTQGQAQNGYLLWWQSSCRYMAFFGLIMILQELPATWYRSENISASAALLELPMLLAMLWFFTSVALMAFSPMHRGLHDYLCGSIVVRATSDTPDSISDRETHSLPKRDESPLDKRIQEFLPAILGTALAIIFWYAGLGGSPAEVFFREHRYQLEHAQPLRIVSVQQQGNIIDVRCLHTDTTPQTQEQQSKLALAVAQFLREANAPITKTQQLRFFFFDPNQLAPSSERKEYIYTVRWSDLSLAVSEDQLPL